MKKIKEILKDYWPLFLMILMAVGLIAVIFVNIGYTKSNRKYNYAVINLFGEQVKEGEIRSWDYTEDKVKINFKDGSIYYTTLDNCILMWKGE